MWGVLSLPNPKLEDHPLSSVHNCLFSIFAATLHVWRQEKNGYFVHIVTVFDASENKLTVFFCALIVGYTDVLLFCCCGRVRLCLNKTAAANRPIVHLPDDACMCMEQWWNDIDSGKPNNLGKDLSQCQFVHHRSHWTDLGLNPSYRNEKLVTNHLSYGMATGVCEHPSF
jgi:hypothetical protein